MRSGAFQFGLSITLVLNLLAVSAADAADWARAKKLIVPVTSSLRGSPTVISGQVSVQNQAPTAGPPSRLGQFEQQILQQQQQASENCPSCDSVELGNRNPANLMPVCKPGQKAHKQAKPVKAKRKPIAVRKNKTPVVAGAVRRSKIALRPRTPVMATAKPVVKTARVTYAKQADCKAVIAKAQALLDANREEEADRFLKDAIEADPQNNCIRHGVAKMSMCKAQRFMQCGKYECAARSLREALFVDPQSKQAEDMLDSVYRQAGVDPLDAGERLTIADCLEKNNRLVGAFVEYNQALGLKETAAGHFGVGRIAEKFEQAPLALKQYAQGLAIDPTNINARRAMGFLQQKSGNWRGAAATLTQALIDNPGDIMAGEGLIQIFRNQLASSPNSQENLQGLMRAYLLNGNESLARDTLAQLQQIDPSNTQWNELFALQKENSLLSRRVSDAANAMDKIDGSEIQDFITTGPKPNAALSGYTKQLLSTTRTCPCN